MCIYSVCFILVYPTVPDRPMNIRFPASDITSTSFVVQWDVVDDTDLYSVTWRTGRLNSSRETATSQTSRTVTGLTPNTTYAVTIAAFNTVCGRGSESDVVMVITADMTESFESTPSSSSSSFTIVTMPASTYGNTV